VQGARGCTMSVRLGVGNNKFGSESAPDVVAPMDEDDTPKDADNASPPATKRFGGPAFLFSVRALRLPTPHTTRPRPRGCALRDTSRHNHTSLDGRGVSVRLGRRSTAL
jgi:hypothetical protein